MYIHTYIHTTAMLKAAFFSCWVEPFPSQAKIPPLARSRMKASLVSSISLLRGYLATSMVSISPPASVTLASKTVTLAALST